jgi:DNA-binding MarR family transcriptional regulator
MAKLNDLASLALRFTCSPAWRDFTLRQVAILGVIADEPGPHTIRGIAARLQLSKPVVCRAITTLWQLIERRRDPRDRRNVFLLLTLDGRRLRDDLLLQARADG